MDHKPPHPPWLPPPPLVGGISDFSEQALTEHRLWLEQNMTLPASRVLGGLTVVTVAPYIGTTETTTSLSFTDLATVGPQITGLSPGQYLISFGCVAASAAGDEADMGVDVNGTGVDATKTVVTLSTAFTSLSIQVVMSLTASSNTLTAKYLSVAGGTASFGRRWLNALKFSN